MKHADAAIAGGGIIGLSTALELGSAGLRVVVFERGQAMREASWAAAGMLAASDPENPAPLSPLSKLSVGLYPEFLARVERLSGKKIPLRTAQTLQGAREIPEGAKPLSPAAIQSVAPGLQPGGLNFFLLNEHSLDARDLARALPEAVKTAGVTLLEETAVTSITPGPDSIVIHTTRGEWSAANFINACGAWASALTDVPVSPRKGQMLLIHSSETLEVTLRTPQLYLVPRGD